MAGGPLAIATGEQWTRSGSESISIYVPGPPGTPFSLTYSYSVTVSASDLSSPCSSGYTLAYFQGLKPRMSPPIVRTHAEHDPECNQDDHGRHPEPDDDGSFRQRANLFAGLDALGIGGVQTGDSSMTGCTPPRFTGSASVDSTLLVTVGIFRLLRHPH